MFSTFDSKIIGEVLEYLVTLFEGEKYCYQEALKKQLEENTIQYPKELQKILTLPPTNNK